MATGASGCDVAVILIDARYGVLVQTRRHTFITSLLGIKHVIVAVNKMDLVGFSEEVFDRIRSDYNTFAAKLGIEDLHFIPLSALNGDNVVDKSAAMPWYQGSTLMHLLENVHIASDRNFTAFRFPVQRVNRPNLDFRGYSGTVEGGTVRPGELVVLPSGKRSRVTHRHDGWRPHRGLSAARRDVDARGRNRHQPRRRAGETDAMPFVDDRFEADLVWLNETALVRASNTSSNTAPASSRAASRRSGTART
jgi:sulfate adenylyltransferase subunit 1 (EFTu-like GTPase family)